MWRGALIVLVVSSTGVAVAAPTPDPSAKDLKRLQGEWRLTAATENGTEYPPEQHVWTWLITGTALRELGGTRGEVINGTIRLDATTKPPSLDLTDRDDGLTARGIYRLDGDTLTVCVRVGGGERPKEFACKAGSRTVLIVFKRVKK
jgi:uncharacterized protein (TIGR03067 family)